MIKVTIETDTLQEFDTLVGGYLTVKKRAEFKENSRQNEAVVKRLNILNDSLENSNRYLKAENSKLSNQARIFSDCNETEKIEEGSLNG